MEQIEIKCSSRPRKKKGKVKKMIIEAEDYQQKHDVNYSKLLPEKLMKILITVENKEVETLLDTGASNNLIGISLVKELNLAIDKQKNPNIYGLGMAKVDTYGKVWANV